MKSERESIQLQKQQRCYLLARKLLSACSTEEIYRKLKVLELSASLLSMLIILSVRVWNIIWVAQGQKCVIREECVNV